MYLSKLDLHGFKSFAGRTDLQFDPGVTAVVGPNGCGKSNIVDAVRWVIGEQRARVLRSEKMENIIFNGTSKRRPLGMAEVKLTIENSRGVLPVEYSEVTIGRRLFRSGESEYLLNGVQCRLKDITDLFMDTGMGAGAYSVIELKMIEEILSENAQDRRRLFEEAAGITRYKLRRAQTMRKLDSTQADLTRLRDLVDEIDKRVRSLKRQANKAARYKEFEDELRTLELAFSFLEYTRLNQQGLTIDDEMRDLHDDLEGQNARQSQFEADLESLRIDQIKKEEILVTREAGLQSHLEEVRRIEADLRLIGQRLETVARDRVRSERERAEALDRIGTLKSSVIRFDQLLTATRPELERLLHELERARETRDLTSAEAEALRTRLQEARDLERSTAETMADTQRNLDRLVSRKELLEQDGESCLVQSTELSSAAETLAGEVATASDVAEEKHRALAEGRKAVSQAETERRALEQDVEEATNVLRRIEKQREAAATEEQLLGSLVTSYEDFSEAVQFLAEQSSQSGAELKTVADLVSCHERDRLALDAALGDMASCIVVGTETEAGEAMVSLRRQDKGRATFLILSRLEKAAGRLELATTSHGELLENLTRIADEYRPLIRVLLHNCVITDSTDEAAEVARRLEDGYRVFSRTGEWVDVRGIVFGGSDQPGTSTSAARLGRREQLDAARERLQEYDRELAVCASKVDDLKRRLEQDQLADKRMALALAEQTAVEADKALARVEFQLGSLNDRVRELADRQKTIRDTVSSTEVEIEDHKVAVDKTRMDLVETSDLRADVEERFNAAEALSRAALTAFSEANLLALEKRNDVENLERDIERTGTQIDETTERAERLTTELTQLEETAISETEKRDVLRDKLSSVREDRPDLESTVSAAKDEVMETRSTISSLEAELRKVRQTREERMREENTRAVRKAEIQTRLEDLLEHVKMDFDVNLETAEIEIPEGMTEVETRDKVHDLRDRIRSMGPVNALALNEYETEKERFDFLSTQLIDLEKAEETLLETITEINTTAASRFDETFQAIRTNFSDLFRELFGDEAAADVVLVDEADPLESAIEVFARPRGKRPSVLAQLSGGEKTLTAIALLFAIYLVKPSPFCILDEVDAPLDDANVTRFMHLIRKFSETTQFILVTHNKRTMEAADRMYGVTMQEQGVSSLVGVRFEEALETV
jgi:chromosome segregation protein